VSQEGVLVHLMKVLYNWLAEENPEEHMLKVCLKNVGVHIMQGVVGG